MSLDDLAAFLDDPDNTLLLGIPGALAVTAALWGVFWVCQRLSQFPARQRPHQSVGHQRLDLSEERDPVEEFIENALRYDRDQRRLRGDDLHDVFGDDDD